MSIGGLSEVRLGRLHDVMAGYVEVGEVPGPRVGLISPASLARGGQRIYNRSTLP